MRQQDRHAIFFGAGSKVNDAGGPGRIYREFADQLEQETDPARQQRWRTMMELTMQLMTQKQLYISELESEAKAAAPTGNPESPGTPAMPPSNP